MAFRTNKPIESITTVGISGTVTGSTSVGTTDPNMRFVAQFINVELTSLSGTLTIPPTISIGTNSTSYNNLLAGTALTGVNAANIVMQISATALSSSVATGTGIFVNVTAAATGVSLTYTMRVTVLGFYY